MLRRCSSRELQEYHILRAIQAEERGDLPPPEHEPDDDEDADDEPADEDLAAMVAAERQRVEALKEPE